MLSNRYQIDTLNNGDRYIFASPLISKTRNERYVTIIFRPTARPHMFAFRIT
ncbi:conserved hypothetical protein [Stutzerimonas stutzeri A1501]|uniref:Uncharacterized protein n=1 Tax=Stutzerimonas stutzeri (strain A1501) TaxID=379731 RepID=A4VP61_STUS1|nr:conserved hypothetical protein [Stutzerimonas stutzeri A1501]